VAPFFQSRVQRRAVALCLAALGAIGFLPLFGGPGYEHALASGLLIPSLAAAATALEVSSSSRVDPLAAVARGLASGAALATVALLTALAHGLRAGFCDLGGGVLLFTLTAGVGALEGGVWGAVAGEVARSAHHRRTVASALAVSAPLAGIAISVARFYWTPMIFAFDPFFGYFSGALYDTVVDVRTELWSYRGGSAATLTAAVMIAASLTRRADGRLTFRPLRGRSLASLCAGGMALCASTTVAVCGPALGHWQSAATIARSLGGRAAGPRCDVVFADSLTPDQAALVVRDCEEELAAVEARLGVHLDGHLTEFVFADANQKRALMGAAETSIAKPWRREVYVQYARYPHPVLGHEIAHVVAGSFAPGPFHVGGGVWPNPGLIEGLAVATSPDDDELTGAQWARAMMDLAVLPPLRELFSLGFLGESAAKSYTVAGAFVAWALDRWGAPTVLAWYGGGSIERLTGQSWASLESTFRDSLRALSMPPEAQAYARARFDRPSVWRRRCPHAVDALDRAADRCREEHRFRQAALLYTRALAEDPGDVRARFERARVELRYGDAMLGRSELDRIEQDERAPRTWRDRAQEALADDDLARGRTATAAEGYDAIAARTLDEDAARSLEVKSIAAGVESARGAIADLLVGPPRGAVEPWLGALSLGLWIGADRDPLAEYLAGKNLAAREQWARALPWLDRAWQHGPATPRIRRELLRETAACACALGDTGAIERVARVVLGPESPFSGESGGRRDWLLRLVTRCTRSATSGS
jgi:hypothetical protein